jgi:cytochrome c-type biogenesis protein CcmH
LTARSDRRLAAARARLLALKAEHDAGHLDDASHAERRRTVEHEIGELLMGGQAAVPTVRPSARLVAILAVAVLAVAAAGYWQTGSPALARVGPAPAVEAAAADPAGAASAASGLKQIEAMVGQLAARMKEKPDDAQGWMMLARSYTVLGRFAEALPAYQRASELQPPTAALLADWADAVAATKGSASNPQTVALVERALALDPTHLKSLALAGTIAYERGDFDGATTRWQKIVDQLPPGNEIAQQVQASIAEARERAAAAAAQGRTAPGAAMAPTALASASNAAAAGRPAPTGAAAGGGVVSGVVTLDPALRAQAAAGDVVFVFARPASGGRMPLAVLRAKVSDLPLSFKLDDSMAMAPGMTISSVPLVTVGARISKTGNALPQPGDLAGETTGVAPGTSGLAINIGSVVGPR